MCYAQIGGKFLLLRIKHQRDRCWRACGICSATIACLQVLCALEDQLGVQNRDWDARTEETLHVRFGRIVRVVCDRGCIEELDAATSELLKHD